ncbi:hypothetical protein B0H16DRAFT_1452738 [Mycena metata]|uniref:Uncharacterized protein n=1 Tax=Mycena metata TaxID=1033252 RepID=A0AAD7NNP3_9AGAR|nr:hypothetical protein B0H16DRAFT_1452738 [Mycena metata]
MVFLETGLPPCGRVRTSMMMTHALRRCASGTCGGCRDERAGVGVGTRDNGVNGCISGAALALGTTNRPDRISSSRSGALDVAVSPTRLVARVRGRRHDVDDPHIPRRRPTERAEQGIRFFERVESVLPGGARGEVWREDVVRVERDRDGGVLPSGMISCRAAVLGGRELCTDVVLLVPVHYSTLTWRPSDSRVLGPTGGVEGGRLDFDDGVARRSPIVRFTALSCACITLHARGGSRLGLAPRGDKTSMGVGVDAHWDAARRAHVM